jgi:hypothetical protein
VAAKRKRPSLPPPRHGDVRRRCLEVIEHGRAFSFLCGNGEGFALARPEVERRPCETKWCESCGDWIVLRGALELLQGHYCGCPRCRTAWPAPAGELWWLNTDYTL